MTANHSMALRVLWSTRLDDGTPAPDARELLEMCGLVEPGGHEILPDRASCGRLLDERGNPVATAPVRSGAAPAPVQRRQGGGRGRKPLPIAHGTDHGYRQHKQKKEPIPADDACGCQAAHDALLERPRFKQAAVTRPPSLGDVDADSPPPEPTVKRRGGRPRQPINHGTPGGYQAHKRHEVPIPDDDSCGCRAARKKDNADRNRAARAHKRGDVAAGPPDMDPPLAPWEKALVADPFDPDHPALQVPPGFVPGGSDDEPPTVTAAPDPARQPPAVPTSPTDLDEWIAAAQRSRRPAVRRHAQTAVLKLLQLRCALDDLARAEREAR